MLMETYIKGNGMKAKLVALESTLIKMAQCTEVNGKMTNTMERELKPGTSVPLSMMANLVKPRKQERVDLNLTVIITRAILKTVNSKDKESTILLILAKSIMENSLKITSLGMVLCSGLITLATRVNSLTVKWKARESRHGQTETDMKACGRTIFNMDKVSSTIPRQIRKLQKNGEMVSAGPGRRLLDKSPMSIKSLWVSGNQR